MFMNTLQEIPPEELQSFKQKVGTWLKLDQEIVGLETKLKELKKIRNKQLEPEITGFMRQFNISDLNTNNGKIKCNARNTKKALNNTYIRDNLLKVINDTEKVDEAMDSILMNREIVTTYKLVKPKIK